MQTYAVVVATRNRQNALALSLPRVLSQNRRASQLIVVDSSDDHNATVDVIKKSIEGQDIDHIVINSKAGASYQRNIGLEHVRHPIVFMPDDDSIWFQGLAASVMEVYDNDVSQRISGVATFESPTPPPGFNHGGKANYKMNPMDRLRQRIGPWRYRAERKFVRDPAVEVAERLIKMRDARALGLKHGVVPVPWMTGFRMSFRTNVIQKIRFDERLGRYSLFEDLDASLAAWKEGMVVAAPSARTYHFKSPERRGNGYNLGFSQILNRSYVILKHTDERAKDMGCALLYFRYKLFQYSLSAHTKFGRDRLRGAWKAYNYTTTLMAAAPEDLGTEFSSIRVQNGV